MKLCADCHADRARMTAAGVDPDAVGSYMRSFHYKAIRFGASGAAVCEDCHSSHRILPAADPRSTIAAAALPSTCGQSGCHPGARRNFAVSGANHLNLRAKHAPVLALEERFFWLLTSGTLAMLVIGIVLDIQTKFGWLVLLGAALGGISRLAARLTAVAARPARRAVGALRWLLVE